MGSESGAGVEMVLGSGGEYEMGNDGTGVE